MFLGLFLVGLAVAANGPSANFRGEAQSLSPNIRERLNVSGEITLGEKKVVLRKINHEIMQLRAKRAHILTKLNLSEDELNNSRLRIKLSNGRNAEIKIMPETASEQALRRLRLKRCNDTSVNCSIELKEVGQGNQTRLVYEARAKKMFRLFGIFKNREEVMTQIDAETGEEIRSRRPWWAWLASEEDEAEEVEE